MLPRLGGETLQLLLCSSNLVVLRLELFNKRQSSLLNFSRFRLKLSGRQTLFFLRRQSAYVLITLEARTHNPLIIPADIKLGRLFIELAIEPVNRLLDLGRLLPVTLACFFFQPQFGY